MENFASFGNISNSISIKNYCYLKRMVCNILVDLFDMLKGFDFSSPKSVVYKNKAHVNFLLENYVTVVCASRGIGSGLAHSVGTAKTVG